MFVCFVLFFKFINFFFFYLVNLTTDNTFSLSIAERRISNLLPSPFSFSVAIQSHFEFSFFKYLEFFIC